MATKLNTEWRLMSVSSCTGDAWHGRVWFLQQFTEGAWRNRFFAKTAAAVRNLVKAKVGPINADAVKILNALPERSDIRKRAPT